MIVIAVVALWVKQEQDVQCPTQWMQIDFGVVIVGEKDAQVVVNGRATFVHGGKHKGSHSLQCIAQQGVRVGVRQQHIIRDQLSHNVQILVAKALIVIQCLALLVGRQRWLSGATANSWMSFNFASRSGNSRLSRINAISQGERNWSTVMKLLQWIPDCNS